MFSGAEIWSFEPGDGVHGLCVSFVPDLNAYATILRPYENGGDYKTCLLDRDTGNVINKFVVPNGHAAFVRNGNQMLFANGVIVSTLNGEFQTNIEFMAGIA